jgi:hypothetical protein
MLHRPLTLGSAIRPQRKAIVQSSEEEVATKKPAAAKEKPAAAKEKPAAAKEKPAAAKRGRKAAEPVKPRTSGRPRNAVQSYKEATPDSEDVVPKKRASRTKQRKEEAAEDSDSSIHISASREPGVSDLIESDGEYGKASKFNEPSDEEEFKPKPKKTAAKRKAEDDTKM